MTLRFVYECKIIIHQVIKLTDCRRISSKNERRCYFIHWRADVRGHDSSILVADKSAFERDATQIKQGNQYGVIEKP